MDKTIEIIVVAAITMIAAAVIAFLLQSETSGFSGFLGNQSDQASCGLKKTRYKHSLTCEDGVPQGGNNQILNTIKQECNVDVSTSCENGEVKIDTSADTGSDNGFHNPVGGSDQ